MFGNLMDKLQGAQQDVKKRLDNILVDGQAEGGKIKVVASGNKEIRQIFIDEDFFAQSDKEAIEDLVMVAVNKALKNAEEVSAREMQSIAKDLLPGGFPGMF